MSKYQKTHCFCCISSVINITTTALQAGDSDHGQHTYLAMPTAMHSPPKCCLCLRAHLFQLLIDRHWLFTNSVEAGFHCGGIVPFCWQILNPVLNKAAVLCCNPHAKNRSVLLATVHECHNPLQKTNHGYHSYPKSWD